MKCPECVKENKKSRVHIGAASTTLMWSTPYYDEDGKYHSHDYNRVTTNYSCSNGHSWGEIHKQTCPSCDWTN